MLRCAAELRQGGRMLRQARPCRPRWPRPPGCDRGLGDSGCAPGAAAASPLQSWPRAWDPS
eukprot:8988967-Lingulodinium_polyedra.AAC.1